MSMSNIKHLVDAIRDKEDDIADIQAEIEQITAERYEKIDEKKLEALKMTVQKKVTEYKLLLNDKAALFEEMYTKALLMINADTQIVQN